MTLVALLSEPTPIPTPSIEPTPTCQRNSEFCEWLFKQTGQRWLAESSYYALAKPLTIIGIVLLALIARWLLHRVINKVIGNVSTGSFHGLFNPLRERMPVALQEATGARSERRRQRAEALGSVLRSVASATIFSIAFLMILSELGLNLAPILTGAGVAGLAVGFGAQNLVKDFIAGLFMLLEDQYGVGDVVDVGEANGTVVAVGLRVTTIRDGHGVLWYIRNGEIIRVGNKSQGWAVVVVDTPIGFAGVEEATGVLRTAATSLADDPEYAADLIDAPEVLGVEQITVDGTVLRVTAKTTSEAQWRVGRELRRRLTEALERAGITSQLSAARLLLRPGSPGEATNGTDTANPTDPQHPGVGGAT
ncbi:mechanosensitive ion channel [Luedemannella flava]|uniref:Mechanosensitive ion channel n=1 Tax=Luedemannella flava TaxID=349316 RepID=A0ABP4Y7V0_9ACTN